MPPIKLTSIFRRSDGRLRNGWWVAIFLLTLFVLLLPVLLISQANGYALGLWEQVAILLAVTWLCQALRRQPLTEVTGRFDTAWWRDLAAGLAGGGALMAVPALFLFLCGWVRFEVTAIDPAALGLAIFAMTGVAIAEELLFRGFLFQRLIAAIGTWPAQLSLAGLFLLTHLGNEGLHGPAAVLAMVNIFLAGLMFGQAWLRTQRLALPIGLHLGANVVQGNLLGFSVSGTDNQSWLLAHLAPVADWLTGGSAGLEGSLPGLVCLLVLLAILYNKPNGSR
ncbi:CAAX amino terminal protease family protein [Asticcacaulis biprosthecium C19]|uniref:CAAX amino terminal protease family protein n=1 Tax=Asticcacaulis biprosthecium C19 TaxID=715226 RepID=F4QIA6_9CAUL|nr:CPBP family intramembrane glutamic endopeptidase [Asticcacaulis biprosthecium]EGF91744.1 CAAX amino terminal protease family protein [Asticcacaulis biprosthecium C19]